MNKNILINGIQYQNVSNIKVKDAETTDLHVYRNTDDATIQSNDIPVGKIGYGKDGKVIGTYVQPSGEIEGGINFYDQYGAWLISYSLADLPLNALPEIPALDGAGADQYEFEWTMTLDEVNALTEEANIGVDVTAKEGAKTYIIPNELGYSGSTGAMYFYGGDEASTILIDWGDGTENTTLTINANTRASISHGFATKSHNPISISLTSGGEIFLGGGTGSYYLLTPSYNIGKQTAEVRIGKGIKGLSENWVSSYSSVEKILLHNGLYATYAPQGTGSLISANKIKSINIPKSFKEINTAYITSDCWALESLYIHDGVEASKEISYRSSLLKKFVFPKTYNTCNTTRMFYECPILTKIKFPKNKITYTKGQINLLGNSNTISEIDLSNCVAEKYSGMMNSCNQLRQAEVPEGVRVLDDCFASCYNLESIILPASLESITGTNNFSSCYNIKQVIFRGTTPPTVSSSSSLLSSTNYIYKIYVPKGSLDAYATATNLTQFAERMVEY